MAVPTVGFPISVARTYSSARSFDGSLGTGWQFSLSPRLYYATYFFAPPATYQREADITLPGGASLRFVENADGVTYAPAAGRHDVLIKNADGTFTLTIAPGAAKYLFASNGSLTSIMDEYANRLDFAYDLSGKLQRVSDASGSGRYVDVFWGADGRISAVRDSAGRQVQYAYDPQGYLTNVTDVAGRTWTYGYTAGRIGRHLTHVGDPWGRAVTDVTYDSQDRIATYTDTGETYTFVYVGSNTAKRDSAGNQWNMGLNSDGLVTYIDPPANSGSARVSYSFFPDMSLQQKTDEAGVSTLYAYDANGNVSSVTQDLSGPQTVRYDYTHDSSFPWKVTSVTPMNPVTNAVDPNWQAWRYDYYQAGSPAPGAVNHVYRVRSDGTTLDTLATYAYDAKGRITQQTTASGGVTDYAYDAATGNLLSVTGPANNDAGTRPVTTYGNFDLLGRAGTVTDARGHATSYTFDAPGRILTMTLPPPAAGSPLNFTTTYSYDNFDAASGLVFTNITDPNGKVTKLGYDQFGRLVKSVDANNKTTSYTYTKDVLTSITDANNNVTSYSYNAVRRLMQTTFPDGAHESYGYSTDGLLTSKTDRLGQTITYGYDRLKRLTTKTYPNLSKITYTYAGQKLTSVVDTSVTPNETHSFGYDASYRVQSNTQGPRGTVAYTYLPNDKPQTMTPGTGPTATYTYYPDDSLDTITWSPVAQPFKYTYNLAGQYDTITFPNGQTRAFSYDDQGRVLQLANTLGATNLATYAYGYDVDNASGTSTLLGQRTSMTANVPAQGFSSALTKYYYDPLYQLTRVDYPTAAPFNSEVDSWTYDDIGNRLTSTVNGVTSTYSYFKNGTNPLNGQRLANDGVNAYTWDANGSNLTRNGAPGNFTFGYSVERRLSTLTGTETAAYTYDYQGRRSSKTVSGGTTTFLYDDVELLIETAGGTDTSYVFGPGADEPLGVYQAGTIAYVSSDVIGSVVLISSAAGIPQNSYLFDSWGGPRGSSAANLVNSFRYTGREAGEAGLLGYRTRYFQPTTGRFTQEDLLPDALASLSAYLYVGSRPTMGRDPLGLFAIDPSCNCSPWSTIAPLLGPYPGTRERQMGPTIPGVAAAVREACGYLTKSPKCSPYITNTFGSDFLYCMRGACGGKVPIKCRVQKRGEEPYLGMTSPTADNAGPIWLSEGAPQSTGGMGPVILHEMFHLCGIAQESYDTRRWGLRNVGFANAEYYCSGVKRW